MGTSLGIEFFEGQLLTNFTTMVEIKQIVTLREKDIVIGLGEDNKLYSWDWASSKWEPYGMPLGEVRPDRKRAPYQPNNWRN